MPASPERLLLSSVLQQGDLKTAIAHGITAEMFHDYPAEWEWLENYQRRFKKTPSRPTFVGKFPDFKPVNADDTVYLVEEVKKAHVQAVLIDRMQEIAESIAEGDVDAAARAMQASIVEVSAGIGQAGDSDIFTSFEDVLAEVEGRHKKAQEEGAAGIPYGLRTLDELTGGGNPGEFIVVAARLGQGKSWLMQAMAAHATAHGHSALFYALEQTRAQVATRIHALLSQSLWKEVYDSNNLMRGKNYNIVEYRRFLREMKAKLTGALHVSDVSRGRVSPMTVASGIERHNPDAVYIDYLTLMQKRGPDWQGVAELSGDIKTLGSTYGIPMICAAQLNREHGLGREPAGPEAIAQADAIGQDADLVLTFRQTSRHVIGGRVAKNRNGEGDGRFWIEFRPGEGIIREVTYNRAMDIEDADKDEMSAKEDGQ